MAVKVATGEMLLDAVVENPNVKAAVLVDDRGYIIEKRGTASSLKAIDDTDKTVDIENPLMNAGPSENLYLVQAGADFLIVVFDEHHSFERLKAAVDATLEQFDMAPALDDA